jgi:hypothetical protein
MRRVCRRCGSEYRGLACQVCHPRRKRVKAQTTNGELQVETDSCASSAEAGKNEGRCETDASFPALAGDASY